MSAPQITNQAVRERLQKLGPFIYEDDGSALETEYLHPYKYDTGVIYFGQWDNEERNGKGQQFWPDGQFFDGNWVRD